MFGDMWSLVLILPTVILCEQWEEWERGIVLLKLCFLILATANIQQL